MGLIIQAIYSGIFKFFCLPVFLLMLIGRPRFLISFVHKFIEFREPFSKLKLFRFIFFLCCLTVGWSYYRKWALEKVIDKLVNDQARTGVASNVHFIDENLREAHLYERNCYMFFTFIVLMGVVEKFCHSYFKLWTLEDKINEKKKYNSEVKPAGEGKQEIPQEKTPLLKKND